ncbi:DUF5681 domain-containing protein [Qipengyuania sp. DGS5-3]|uniref:DUF5681 domain-containing protein n=1 Tax=Qipengyuania sp. DGS5-3 TaxID=3349632 RepID=UPI0036D2B4BC
MSEEYDVGYGKPPKQHQFQPGNQAARKNKGRKRKQTVSMEEAVSRALSAKRTIRKGGKELSLSIAEIVTERLIQLALSGDSRDLVRFIDVVQRYAPAERRDEVDSLNITIHKAEGSSVELPSDDLRDNK